MTLVAVIAAKGSPGATTTSAALAAVGAMQDHPTFLVEFDPAGGSLALETQLSLDPGISTLMAAARRGFDLSLIGAHTQLLGNGVMALLAPTAPDRARRAVDRLAEGVANAMGFGPDLTIVDCGRWDEQLELTPVLAMADRVLFVLRPTLSGTESARTRLPSLIEINPKVDVVCIGDDPYSSNEAAAALGVPINPSIAHDPRAARLIVSGVPVDRWLRRSSLMRSASVLMEPILASHNLEVSV